MVEISKLSKRYCVCKLKEEDINEVYNLCKENALFYKYCPPFVSLEGIKEDMVVLPPNKTMEDKYYIGFYDGKILVAVMDLILRYPNDNTIFIGFFMMNKSLHNKVIGSSIIKEVLDYLKECGFKYARLGWVEGNKQAANFWKKNEFIETGVKSKTDEYTIVVGERKT